MLVKSIEHVLYINLKERDDRKKHVESQLNSLNLVYHRFDACKVKNPAIGCSLSHFKCIELAKKNKWSHVMIVEDDIQFLDPSLFSVQLNQFLSSDLEWDVLLIAGNNIPPYKTINETCIQVSRCQTTTGYIVRSHYYDTLLNNIKFGAIKLLKQPKDHLLYAIDKYWFSLQEKDNWYLLMPLTVTQLPGFSDIEKRYTNYNKLMLDADKPWLFLGNIR